MDNKEIIKYAEENLSKGAAKEDIYKYLLEAGNKVDDINTAFLNLHKSKEDVQRKTIIIVVTSAAILIGLGVFSFISSNWQELGKPLKLGIIILAIILFYSAGWILKEKYKYDKTGEAFILLGAIMYGAVIFLTAQMFNVRANWPDGFILWMIGTLFMAFALDAFPLFCFAIPLGIISTIGHQFSIFWLFSPFNSFLLTSTLLLFVASVITFIAGTIMKKRMGKSFDEF